ncbi:MAG: hypothetical protein GF411_06015 [Candidatus Lokiarchaeota archaeon]|nr:hypothetical protein [Candidatus Lokiarchaeota archaeon]
MDRIIDLCTTCIKAHGGTAEPGSVLDRIRTVLRQDKESKDFWRLIRSIRQNALHSDSLLPEVSTLVAKLEQEDHEIGLLYGNYLYLLLLALQRDCETLLVQDSLRVLWLAFSDWILVHIGFGQEPIAEEVVSKYDLWFIWTNLQWRVAQLPESPAMEETDMLQALMIDVGSDHHWLVFQSPHTRTEIIAGLIHRSEDSLFQRGWYPCETSPFELKEWSTISWNQSIPLVIQPVGEHLVLWRPQQDGDTIESWWPVGIFEYGRPTHGETAPIRWVRYKRIPSALVSNLSPPEINLHENAFQHIVRKTLSSLSSLTEGVIHVRCRVTLDDVTSSYMVQFFRVTGGDSDKTPLQTLHYLNTLDVIQTLRSPQTTGHPFENRYWWVLDTDVSYEEVTTTHGPVSLTFLSPFTYRNRQASPYLSRYTLPLTAEDLLRMSHGPSITLVADPDLSRWKHPHSRCWNILFLTPDLSPKMRTLQEIDLTIIEVAEIFESMQFIDTSSHRMYSTQVVINNADLVIFPKNILSFSRTCQYLQRKKFTISH